MVTATQQNITTNYITTQIYERDTFDLISIPSQTDITEQRFSEDITLSLLTNSTILYQCYQILIQNE